MKCLLFLLLVIDPLTATIASPGPGLREFFQVTLLSNIKTVWEREPKLWENVEGVNADDLLSFGDIVTCAQAGYFDKANIAKQESAEAGKWESEAIAPEDRESLITALDRGTFFVNGAGLDFPKLAALASTAQRAVGLPVNLNIYLTKPGRTVSVSPHTDAQNVLVMQTQGRKRWRVWEPPKRTPGKNPFGRGKGGDSLSLQELGDPVLDTLLEPGSVLYVPIGFPHATSTATDGDDDDGDSCQDDDHSLSCHVTLGFDTYFYGLCYTTLRALAIARAKSQDTLNPFHVDESIHDRLFSALPFGFLRPTEIDSYDDDAWYDHVASELRDIHQAAAESSGTTPAPFLGTDESIRACVGFLLEHWRTIIDESKYEGVVEPPPMSDYLANLSAKALRNSKNNREEAAQKQLSAFASSSR